MKLIFNTVICFIMLNINFIYSEWNCQDYEISNIGQFKHAIKEVSKLSLTGSESILDIGCRDGRISRYIAKNYLPHGHIIAIDNDESMISLASSRTTDIANISFELGDISTYIPKNNFDGIVSFWSLHWIADYVQALKNISRLLKPGGKALLCHIIDQPHPFDICIQQVIEQPEWREFIMDVPKKFNKPSLEKILDAIKKSEFTIDYMEIKKNGEWLPLDIFKKNLLSVPLFNYINKEKRAAFCDCVIHKYISQNPLNEKGEFFDWLPIIVLILQK